MEFLRDVLFRILAANPAGEEGGGRLYVIIRRPNVHVAERLRQVFEGEENVNIIVDRRDRERRTSQVPVAFERRRADRRRSRGALIDVVVI